MLLLKAIGLRCYTGSKEYTEYIRDNFHFKFIYFERERARARARERERERERGRKGQRERERKRERIPSRLCADSPEPNARLEPMNCEIVT